METFWSFFCLDNWLCQQTGPACLLSSSASGTCRPCKSHLAKMHFTECNLFSWHCFFFFKKRKKKSVASAFVKSISGNPRYKFVLHRENKLCADACETLAVGDRVKPASYAVTSVLLRCCPCPSVPVPLLTSYTAAVTVCRAPDDRQARAGEFNKLLCIVTAPRVPAL